MSMPLPTDTPPLACYKLNDRHTECTLRPGDADQSKQLQDKYKLVQKQLRQPRVTEWGASSVTQLAMGSGLDRDLQ